MAKLIRPLLVRLFPDVPADHPAMGAIIMNLSANVLGLGNAATPFGLKAMKELDALNEEKGTATDAMVLFLAINTSGVAVLPTGIIAMRALNGSTDPASIFPTTLLATSISTLVGITTALLLSALFPRDRVASGGLGPALGKALRTVGFLLAIVISALAAAGLAGLLTAQLVGALGGWGLLLGAGLSLGLALGARRALPGGLRELVNVVIFGASLIGLVSVVYLYGEAASAWILPVLILGMLTAGMARKVKVYEVFTKGAKDGFSMALMIIECGVAVVVAPVAPLVDVQVVHQRQQPAAQHRAGLPQRPLDTGPLQRVLHQVVGPRRVARQQPRIPAQRRNVAQDLLDAHAVSCAQGRARRQAPLKPSPLRSPGFWSLDQKYTGLPL